MKSFVPKMSTPVIAIALPIVFFCSLFVFQVSPTRADDPPETVWVLTETQVNPFEAQREFYGGGATPGWFGEARFEGTFVKYGVTETSFRVDDRWVDHEYEYHNVTIETYFEKPPLKLVPGETIELIYGSTHSGTAEDGGAGIQFWYDSEGVDIQPKTVFAYAPWAEGFDGTSDGTYSFQVPPGSSGSEMELFASWWNSAPCLVVWKYQAQEVSGAADDEAAPDQDEEPVDDDDMPEWVKNGEAYIDWGGRAIYVPEWLDWIKPKKVIKARGVLIEAGARGDDVWVYSRNWNKWMGPIRSDWELYTGDVVATGPDTLVRVVFTNSDGDQDTISLGERTLLEMPEVTGSGDKSDYPTIWTLYSGAIKIKHAILNEPPPRYLDHPFGAVRTGACVVGVRGTEFVVAHDPETETSSIYLVSGELDYYNLAAGGPDDAILTAGQKLVVMGDGTETILPLDEAELESVLALHNIKDINSSDPEESELLVPEEFDTEYQDSSRNVAKLVIIGASLCCVAVLGIAAAIAILFLWRKRAAQGKGSGDPRR